MSQFIKYHGHQVNLYVEGQGEPLIFLHGWPTNAQLWKPQVEALKKDYKVITLDWLGFGQSDKPTDYQYTFTKKKEMLNIALDKLLGANEKVNVIAHDIGGPAAILWVSEHQERVKRLILLNTVLYNFSTTLDKISHFLFAVPLLNQVLMSRFGLKSLLKTLTKSSGKDTQQHINEIMDWHKGWTTPIKLKAILEPLKAGKQNEFLSLGSKFKQLQIAKYLIMAKSDPLCYKHIKKLKDDNPKVPAFTIEHCGHFIPLDKPRELNNILQEILTSASTTYER
ncbi:MAG: alpha/beta hydrolase [Bacteroidota bacterium]